MVIDAEQAINRKILKLLMGSRHGVSLITHRSGSLREDPPGLSILGALSEGLIKF